MKLHTPTANSEWLPGYKLVIIGSKSAAAEKYSADDISFTLGQSALYSAAAHLDRI